MAISVNPILSPRIITVPETDGEEITIQSLVNQIRDWEDNQANLSYDSLLFASGKDDLGGGVMVGVTARLINAKLMFEARAIPTICSVTGGNLVAVDAAGDPMYPLAYSTNVMATITASSSATLQELAAIEFSSFGGMVHVDTGTGYTGTVFPVGTAQAPVNNLGDAQTIATARGFNKVYIYHNLTVGSTDDITDYDLIGDGEERSTITLVSGCVTSGTSFYDMSVQGRQDGETAYVDCEIRELSNVHCKFSRCRLNGPLRMHPTAQDTTSFHQCYGGPVGPVVVDMNNGKMNIGFRAFNGHLLITNSSQSEVDLVFGVGSGKVELDTTVTAGNYILRGVCEFVDNSSGAANVDVTGLVNTTIISDSVWDELESGHTTIGSIGRLLSDLKDSHWNKKVLTKISDTEYREELYDDSGSVVTRTHTISESGNVTTRVNS